MALDNFDKRSRPLVAMLAALALSACGGGSGGPSTGDSGGGNTGGNTGGGTTGNPASGTFVDALVDGLGYLGNPSNTSGVTGDNGTTGGFTVEAGDTVTFSLGNLTLGTSLAINGGDVVTPAELAGEPGNFNNPLAVRIAQLLQSLDSDNDTSNGITIDPAVLTRLTDGTVDVNALQAALTSGTDFETVFGGMIDELTAGNANRAQGSIVSASVAKAELAKAVAQDSGGSAPGVTGGTPIVAAATAACPAGVASSNKVTIFGQQFPVCVLSQDITANTTLTNDHVYVLETAINVGDGNRQGGPTGTKNATLTIEPGTQIFGYNGLQTGLIITRGSKISAVGDADRPIIMAAVEATGSGSSLKITDDPTDLTKRGQWAGLVLSGTGINNQCQGAVTEVETEAVPTGKQRFFGCSNNADSSGTVEYVIIAESGLGFRPDQEVQGLTIEAAGSGTRVNYLQVLGSEDDGIEWFGGAANVSNVVINGADDDSLDFDEGYVGTVQNALVIQGAANGDRGIEADSAGPSDDATPVSRPNLVNLTLLGNQGSQDVTMGALWREGFGGVLHRSAILDNAAAPTGTKKFSLGCLDIDQQIDSNTAFRDVAVDCANGQQAKFDVVSDGDTLQDTLVAGGNDETGNPVAADRRDFISITGSTALNAQTLAVTVGSAPNNPVTPTGVNGNAVGNYYGAVDPASGNPDQDPTNNGAGGGPFWDGWTYINSAVDGGLPGANFHPLQEEIQ